MQSNRGRDANVACLRRSVDALVRVSDVQKEILFVVLLIEAAHGGRGRWDHIVDKEEEGILWPQTDSLANEEVELPNGQIRRYEVFLLVEVADPGFGGLLDDDGNAIRVLSADLLALGTALLVGVLFLVLPLHGQRIWLFRCTSSIKNVLVNQEVNREYFKCQIDQMSIGIE